jgi:hypothetical protein
MKRLLLLYPRAWRERYQAEMEAVLDGMPFDPRAALDLVACAADAHLRPPGGRRNDVLRLVAQLGLLGALGGLAMPLVEQLLRRLWSPPGVDGFVVHMLLPSAVPALAALVAWRAGWGLAAWSCGLLALQRGFSDSGLLSALFPVSNAPQVAWPFAAVVVVLGGGLVALLLRRGGTIWPVGLVIGIVVIGSAEVWVVGESANPPVQLWRYQPLLELVQALAWGALTGALLRRAGLTWPVSLAAGCGLWFLAGSTTLPIAFPWHVPASLWALAAAALASARRVEPAPPEAAPC